MKRASTIVTVFSVLALSLVGVGLRPVAAEAASSIYVVAVGDMACDPSPFGDPNYAAAYNNGLGTIDGCRQRAVGDAVIAAKPDQFWALGDNQYFNGTYAKYLEVYDKAFGPLKNITHPIPGNHEWRDLTLPTKPGSGYFTYFGAASHPETNGTYSFDAGDWHVLAINDNLCDPSHPCGPGSALATWIASDMAASQQPCTVAMWHHPLWSVGSTHAEGYPPMVPVWNQLLGLGADVVLTGHDHLYVRTKPLGLAAVDPSDPTKVATPTLNPNGMVEFVIGTGGEDNYSESTAITDVLKPFLATYSAKQSPGLFGAAGFHLKSDRYTYSYLKAKDSAAFTDSGGRTCRRATEGNPQDVAGEPNITTLATQAVTWTPSNTTVRTTSTTGGTIKPNDKATTSGDGVIRYVISSDGTTDCSVDPNTGEITYSAVGECEVTAMATETAKYSEARRSVVFTITTSATTPKQDITAVQPDAGPRAGGNTVVIVGHGFTTTTKVTFGGTSAKFETVDASHISAIAPPGKQSGPVAIVVTVGGTRGSIVAPGGYTYEAAPAAVTPTTTPAPPVTADAGADLTPLGNPKTGRVLAPGLRLLSRADASRIRSTVLKRLPAGSAASAPKIRIKAGAPFSLVVRGQTPAQVVTFGATYGGASMILGAARVDAKGWLKVPALAATRGGVLTIVLNSPTSKKHGYLKVLVVK